MDISAISAAITSVKAIKDLIEAAITAKTEADVRARSQEILGQVINLQQSLIESQQAMYQLAEQNQKLVQVQRQYEDLQQRVADYQQWFTPKQGLVLRHKHEHRLLACPTCVEKRAGLFHLQPSNTYSEYLLCPECKVRYPYRDHGDLGTGTAVIEPES